MREALNRAKGPEREAFLNQACAGTGSLRARLAALLQAHESPDPFLGAPGDGAQERNGACSARGGSRHADWPLQRSSKGCGEGGKKK